MTIDFSKYYKGNRLHCSSIKTLNDFESLVKFLSLKCSDTVEEISIDVSGILSSERFKVLHVKDLANDISVYIDIIENNSLKKQIYYLHLYLGLLKIIKTLKNFICK
ncbi:hypothetical protein [Wolbachia endosymbiont of Pentidionis agamae]|uniref:hypothetical protein n=1 Tax=Wolbachia endosymbiont of Pentidionis agamae TaxID=3110435 RepID=UPI002FD0CD3F